MKLVSLIAAALMVANISTATEICSIRSESSLGCYTLDALDGRGSGSYHWRPPIISGRTGNTCRALLGDDFDFVPDSRGSGSLLNSRAGADLLSVV
jgi:hypothetical protein